MRKTHAGVIQPTLGRWFIKVTTEHPCSNWDVFWGGGSIASLTVGGHHQHSWKIQKWRVAGLHHFVLSYKSTDTTSSDTKNPCRGQSIYCYLILTENNPAPAWLLFNCFTMLESCPLSIWNSLIIYWLFVIYWRKFQYCLSWLQGFFSHRQKKSYLSSFHLLLWVIVYRLINSILLVHQSSKGSTSYLAGFTEGEEKKLGLRSILSLPPHPLLQIFVTSSWRHSL